MHKVPLNLLLPAPAFVSQKKNFFAPAPYNEYFLFFIKKHFHQLTSFSDLILMQILTLIYLFQKQLTKC